MLLILTTTRAELIAQDEVLKSRHGHSKLKAKEEAKDSFTKARFGLEQAHNENCGCGTCASDSATHNAACNCGICANPTDGIDTSKYQPDSNLLEGLNDFYAETLHGQSCGCGTCASDLATHNAACNCGTCANPTDGIDTSKYQSDSNLLEGLNDFYAETLHGQSCGCGTCASDLATHNAACNCGTCANPTDGIDTSKYQPDSNLLEGLNDFYAETLHGQSCGCGTCASDLATHNAACNCGTCANPTDGIDTSKYQPDSNLLEGLNELLIANLEPAQEAPGHIEIRKIEDPNPNKNVNQRAEDIVTIEPQEIRVIEQMLKQFEQNTPAEITLPMEMQTQDTPYIDQTSLRENADTNFIVNAHDLAVIDQMLKQFEQNTPAEIALPMEMQTQDTSYTDQTSLRENADANFIVNTYDLAVIDQILKQFEQNTPAEVTLPIEMRTQDTPYADQTSPRENTDANFGINAYDLAVIDQMLKQFEENTPTEVAFPFATQMQDTPLGEQTVLWKNLEENFATNTTEINLTNVLPHVIDSNIENQSENLRSETLEDELLVSHSTYVDLDSPQKTKELDASLNTENLVSLQEDHLDESLASTQEVANIQEIEDAAEMNAGENGQQETINPSSPEIKENLEEPESAELLVAQNPLEDLKGGSLEDVVDLDFSILQETEDGLSQEDPANILKEKILSLENSLEAVNLREEEGTAPETSVEGTLENPSIGEIENPLVEEDDPTLVNATSELSVNDYEDPQSDQQDISVQSSADILYEKFLLSLENELSIERTHERKTEVGLAVLIADFYLLINNSKLNLEPADINKQTLQAIKLESFINFASKILDLNPIQQSLFRYRVLCLLQQLRQEESKNNKANQILWLFMLQLLKLTEEYDLEEEAIELENIPKALKSKSKIKNISDLESNQNKKKQAHPKIMDKETIHKMHKAFSRFQYLLLAKNTNNERKQQRK